MKGLIFPVKFHLKKGYRILNVAAVTDSDADENLREN